ncbi:uncharacterized protein LOC106660249 [Trichogramma pretiosum]|uniref:uncharacterized protein LOC106660249 n=1 Tax=Trichogramma pretiosum TaxID=7493 RepID=UPI0006C95645|nr:uncharacterized protein LOC106660249 [Trichogramma pretiosum]
MAKIDTVEEGYISQPIHSNLMAKSSAEELKISQKRMVFFKTFVLANLIIILIFCCYAVYSIYSFKTNMRPKDYKIHAGEYHIIRSHSSLREAKIKENVNNTEVIEDWRESIIPSLENAEKDNNTSYNLKSLFQTITSLVKNYTYIDDDKSKSESKKILKTNLSGIEINMLKELAKLKKRPRLRRTIKSDGEDDSECDLKFTLVTSSGIPAQLILEAPQRKRFQDNSYFRIVLVKNNNYNKIECTLNLNYRSHERTKR